jgi:hypothetical protein
VHKASVAVFATFADATDILPESSVIHYRETWVGEIKSGVADGTASDASSPYKAGITTEAVINTEAGPMVGMLTYPCFISLVTLP